MAEKTYCAVFHFIVLYYTNTNFLKFSASTKIPYLCSKTIKNIAEAFINTVTYDFKSPKDYHFLLRTTIKARKKEKAFPKTAPAKLRGEKGNILL